MLTPLATMLKYKNIKVLNRYKADYSNNKLSAEEAFEELIKFFWVTQKHKIDKSLFPENHELNFICGIHSEMKEIDDMWHTFLLFTKDYIAFCKEYFGEFFHHSPTDKNEQLTIDAFELDFTRFLSYVYDNLGEDTVVQWFSKLYAEEDL